MKQYFYLFNYPPEEYDLCALEFKYLFHEEYQQCFITNKDIDVNISVFMKGKIDVWAISSNFDDLKEEVKRQNNNADGYGRDEQTVWERVNAADRIRGERAKACHRSCNTEPQEA